jgi:hypothetical protein
LKFIQILFQDHGIIEAVDEFGKVSDIFRQCCDAVRIDLLDIRGEGKSLLPNQTGMERY